MAKISPMSYTERKSVLHVLAYILQMDGNTKKYACPSQEKIRELLKKFYGVDRCIRTINYWLRSLDDESFMHRIVRHTRGPEGQMVFKTTAYYLLPKAYKLLGIISSAVSWIDKKAQKVARKVTEKIFREKTPEISEEQKAKNREGIKKLLETFA